MKKECFTLCYYLFIRHACNRDSSAQKPPIPQRRGCLCLFITAAFIMPIKKGLCRAEPVTPDVPAGKEADREDGRPILNI